MKQRGVEIKFSVLLLLVLALLASCAKQDSVQEAPLTRAYRLIDAQRDDEAIAYLEELIKDDPESNDNKVALASAYAHKAKIKVQKFAGILVDSKKMSDISDTFAATDPSKEMTFKVDDFANNLATLLLKYNKMLTVYAEIPSVADADEIYLEEAIFIMEAIEKPRQADGFYRSVLRAIQFKHLLATDLIGSISDTHQAGAGCSLDLTVMNTSVIMLAHLLMNIYDDMAIATPSKAKDLTSQKSKIADKTFSLTLIVTGMSVADEASNLFIKHMVIEEGFGKLLKCTDGDTKK